MVATDTGEAPGGASALLHLQGVVHRDVKPEVREGEVKEEAARREGEKEGEKGGGGLTWNGRQACGWGGVTGWQCLSINLAQRLESQ